MRKVGMPLPPNTLRDAVLLRLKSEHTLHPHPAQRSVDGTKYISAFLAASGKTIAIEKSLVSGLPIWLVDAPKHRSTLENFGVRFDHYAAGAPRNSNLKPLPGFGAGALLRAHPRTVEEAMALIREVCAA